MVIRTAERRDTLGDRTHVIAPTGVELDVLNEATVDLVEAREATARTPVCRDERPPFYLSRAARLLDTVDARNVYRMASSTCRR
jgi:hypothetical protein